MNLSDLHDAKVSDVAALPVSVHAALQAEYAALQARAKRIGATLDAALEMAYAGKNEAGTSHVYRDGYDVKVTTPKRVEWDVDALTAMAEGGGDAAEYIDWTPKVAESRYKAAPDRIRSQLDGARTVKLGKPKIEISEKEE